MCYIKYKSHDLTKVDAISSIIYLNNTSPDGISDEIISHNNQSPKDNSSLFCGALIFQLLNKDWSSYGRNTHMELNIEELNIKEYFTNKYDSCSLLKWHNSITWSGQIHTLYVYFFSLKICPVLFSVRESCLITKF